jgi:BlaI family transcriptional regulator, penicillinase repressor
MASSVQLPRGHGPRKSILDLAPLELDCMNTLWPLSEGTVRQIQQRLARSRPRAYTTIMTIMDRLARKGLVTRRKVGRAYLYRPNLTPEEARTHAIEQVVEGFFAGSPEALAEHLAGRGECPSGRNELPGRPGASAPSVRVEPTTEPSEVFPTTRLDESLL